MFTDLHQYQALQTINNGYWINPEGILQGPNTTWKPLPENATQHVIVPRSQILHTNDGDATWEQLWHFLSSAAEVKECHFDVDNTGRIGQFMSVLRQADCNFDANSWVYNGTRYGAISIETADHGGATLDTTGWNFEQLASLVAILTAVAIQFNTGCNEVLKWDGAGIDYHTKFPYHGPGIKAWTNIAGKTCPGKQRKLQTPFLRNAVADNVGKYIQECQKLGVAHGLTGL